MGGMISSTLKNIDQPGKDKNHTNGTKTHPRHQLLVQYKCQNHYKC